MFDISRGMNDRLLSGRAEGFLLVEFDLAEDPLRLWTGTGPLEWDGRLFHGSGTLGTIAGLSGSLENRRGNLTLSLSGLDPEVLERADATAEPLQDTPVNIWFGVFRPDGEIEPSPVQLARRRVNTLRSVEDSSATLTVTTYGRYEDLNKADAKVWDHATHQAEHPGDQFFSQHLELLDLPLDIQVRD